MLHLVAQEASCDHSHWYDAVSLRQATCFACTLGQVLKHVTFTVERNPFSEQLEVAGIVYVPLAPAKS